MEEAICLRHTGQARVFGSQKRSLERPGRPIQAQDLCRVADVQLGVGCDSLAKSLCGFLHDFRCE
jgi:hypothetical protein